VGLRRRSALGAGGTVGTALAIIAVFAIIALIVGTRVLASQQTHVEVPLPPGEVTRVIDECFRPAFWSRVAGPGHINVKGKLKAHAPTISMTVKSSSSGARVGCWMSSYTTRYGILFHGGTVIRKRRGLAKRLASAGAIAP
jgi:hypothetical protein